MIAYRPEWLAAQTAKLKALASAPFTSEFINTPTETFKAQIIAAVAMHPKNGSMGALVANGLLTYGTANVATNSANLKSESFRQMAQALINPAIAIYDDAATKAQAKGSARSFSNFLDHLNALNLNPTSEPNKEAVRIAFHLLENDMSTLYICSAQKVGYEIQALQEYALYATFHLLLLREVMLRGLSWGYLQSSIDLYTSRFKEGMITYQAWINKWYQAGLAIVTAAKDPKYDFRQWNRINRYKRDMTRFVFDFVAIWWTFDPKLFPKGVIQERVRYLFSDIIGVPTNSDGTAPTVDQIYANIKEKELNRYMGSFYYNRAVRFNNGPDVGGDITGRKKMDMMINSTDIYMAARTFSSTSDLLPRKFSIDPYGVFPGETITLSKQLPIVVTENATPSDPEGRWSVVEGPQVRQTVGIDGHKIGMVCALGVNNAIKNAKYYPDLGGAIDSMIVGWIPNEIESTNLIMANISTIVDCQKYIDNLTAATPAVVDIDRIMLGSHCTWIRNTTSLRYRFDLEPGAQMTYNLAIRVHGVNLGGNIAIFNSETPSVVMATANLPVGLVPGSLVPFNAPIVFTKAVDMRFLVTSTVGGFISCFVLTPII
eukprot:gene4964-5771_t